MEVHGLIWVIAIVTLLITPLIITTHAPGSLNLLNPIPKRHPGLPGRRRNAAKAQAQSPRRQREIFEDSLKGTPIDPLKEPPIDPLKKFDRVPLRDL